MKCDHDPPVTHRPALFRLQAEIITCRACPRLVEWRQEAAHHPPRRFQGERYWARPLPGFGDPDARLIIVGLAPAAHGGNRTGRMFTGDRSGDFLFAALHRLGCANQSTSTQRNDGMALHDTYITAAVRCAPPANRPSPAERSACFPWLAAELDLLARKHVLLALGRFAFDACRRYLRERGADPAPTPARGCHFAHGAAFVTRLTDAGTLDCLVATAGSTTRSATSPAASSTASPAASATTSPTVADAAQIVQSGHPAGVGQRPVPLALVASFHPSQQNTFTGRLTPARFDEALHLARKLAQAEDLAGIAAAQPPLQQ